MNLLRFLGAAFVAATLFGCATKGKTPLVAECKKDVGGDRSGPALIGLEYGRQATPIPLDSVQFSNWKIAKSVAIQRLFATRTETNSVQVTARFFSCSDQPVSLLVRTSFMGANQAPTEKPSAWQQVFVQPRMTGVYSESSTSKNVANYLLEIMPGQ